RGVDARAAPEGGRDAVPAGGLFRGLIRRKGGAASRGDAAPVPGRSPPGGAERAESGPAPAELVPACHRGPLQARLRAQARAWASACRRAISSAETSSTWVAIHHWLPQGSRTPAERSP